MGIFAKLISRLKEKATDERAVVDDAAVLFEKEYDEFRQEMLSLSKAEIYDNAGMIHFFLNVRDAVVYSDELDYEMALKINTDKPIRALWEKYLDTELSIENVEEFEYLLDLTFPMEKGGQIICVDRIRGNGDTGPLKCGSGN